MNATSRFDDGLVVHGMNFGSQDYLGLSTDPRVREAGMQAIRDHGVHRRSSGTLQGGTRPSLELEPSSATRQRRARRPVPDRVGRGFGAITALVRPDDHIVMDRLAHASLQQGAQAATQNIHRHRHLDVEEATALVAQACVRTMPTTGSS